LEDVDIAGCVWVSTSAHEADAAATLKPMVSYFGPYLEDDILAPIGLTTHDFDPIRSLHAEREPEKAAAAVTDQMLRLAIVGTPDDVVEQFDDLARLGVTQINIGGPLGPDPKEAIDLIGTHVIPRFA
jgi:5,10-methylenetetrahydromethanopterin reductase